MKRIVIIWSCILLCLLMGCTKETDTTKQGEYPYYFQPIVDEIHSEVEKGNNDWWYLSAWNEPAVYGADDMDERFLSFYGECKEKSFTFYYKLQKSKWKTLEEENTFDLSPYFSSQSKEEWIMAACFYKEERDTLYILLHKFLFGENLEALQEQEGDASQLLLLEYSLKSGEQHVTAYKVEPITRFAWTADCRLIGDTIYIAEEPSDSREIAAIDLETRELRYCVDEYEALEKYASESFDMEKNKLMLHEAVYEQGDVTVFSAKVGDDGFDGPATAHVFVAFKDGEPIEYLCYDVESKVVTN